MIGTATGGRVIEHQGVLVTRCPLCWRDTLHVAIEDGVFFCGSECSLIGHDEGLLRLARAADRMLPFSAEQARALWQASRERERTHDRRDQGARGYLAGRGLLDALEMGAAGLIGPGMALPWRVNWWPSAGYRVVAPLFDNSGELVALQARSIRLTTTPKTMFPRGTVTGPKYFANLAGQDLLAGRWRGRRVVVVGEGLTDSLALALALADAPVLCIPGAGVRVLGPWVAGLDVVLALDLDAAGAAAVRPLARAASAAGANRVRRLTWPGSSAKDAADVLADIGVKKLRQFLVEVTRG